MADYHLVIVVLNLYLYLIHLSLVGAGNAKKKSIIEIQARE